jgi:hypothetical protein
MDFLKNLQGLVPVDSSTASILRHRKEGVIYTADFGSGTGRYISSAIESSDPIDVRIHISPKVELRIAYIFDGERISGLKLTKLTNKGELESIHLSTLDWEGVLALLQIFSGMDMQSLARRNLILNDKISQNPKELEAFLRTVSVDPDGREKMAEIAKNFGLINPGDIDEVAERRQASVLFDKLLNHPGTFASYKDEIGVRKNEEVWQRFFKDNTWILGAEYIEILDERVLDTENITDYIMKSYDGFADIVELKLPGAQFWNAELIPNADLTRALMQCMRYISAIERKINDLEFHKKLEGTAIVKPRITLIYGRSDDWEDLQRETYRILNSNLHSISVLTYDHVIERAKRMTAKKSAGGTS